jgi:dipeptidyl aminopeptidase/acylaminoacyl peptidase
MTTVYRSTVRIPTPSGFDIEAWFYQPEGQGPFPAVVMGHGLGAVKVGGLASFAERFCREGFAAVVIDYRQWGGTGGQQPRDELNVPRQREDYNTAIGWAAAQPNIDEHRIFVWGTSFAGMHATALAATDHRLVRVGPFMASHPLVNRRQNVAIGLTGLPDVPAKRTGATARWKSHWPSSAAVVAHTSRSQLSSSHRPIATRLTA